MDSEEPEVNMWTVYERPKDFPDGFIARMYWFDQPTRHVFTGNTLEQVREQLLTAYPGLYRLDRNDEDEPQIVETWL